MPHLTLGQAAKLTGLSKATLSKALKSGKLSYVSKDSSGYQIEPSELFRVFPPKQEETPVGERLETPRVTLEKDLEAKLREVEWKAAALSAQLEEVRSDRDAWREQAQRLALAAPSHTDESPRGFRAFFSGLRGRK